MSAPTAVAASDVAVVLALANVNRRGLIIYNDTDRALYVKLGADATLDSWTAKLYKDDVYELPSPIYTGEVTGIWDAGVGGRAMVTESVL